MKKKTFSKPVLHCLVFLLIIAVPVLAQSKKDKDLAKNLNEQADKAVSAKNFRDAIGLYEKSLALQPNNSNAHYRKGFAHFSLKENDQAVQEFSLALLQGFRPLEIYRIRYFIYFEQSKFDAALADINKGLELAPNDLNFLNAIGEINYARKSYTEAQSAFKKVSQIAPNNADVHYNLARVAFGMGDSQAQLSAAETALAKGTRFLAETFYLLADASRKLKKPSAAIDAYRKAINAKPNMYEAYRHLAEVYQSESRFDDAVEISKLGLRAFPNDGNLYTDLGLYYSLADRHEDAVGAARAGTQIQPDNPAGFTNLCRAYSSIRDFASAIVACTNSLRLRPDDGETYYYLGNALVGQGKSVEATKAYTNAVKGLVDFTAKNPGQSEGWYLLGNSFFADKQYDRAIDSYLKCLSLSPNYLRARVNLGISYTRKKDKAAAMEQYNFLLKADSGLAARVKAEIDKM